MRRRWRWAIGLALGLALGLGLAAGPVMAAPAPPDTAATHAREGFVSRRDFTRLVFAAAAIAIVSHHDLEFTRDATKAQGGFARDLSRVGEHFGNPVYSGPALAALWAYGRLSDRRGLSHSALRIAGGVVASAVVAGGLKEVVGRWRPNESPDDPSRTRAFSGHASFPSGHTTVAFGLAAGIDQETRPRWVPWVVYPLAGVTAWSRVHDREHWASDVVAGAVVGLWATHKFRLVVDSRGVSTVVRF